MSKDRVFELCDIVRETGFEIHRYHGPGHLEKVYENALVHRLRKKELKVEQQHPLKVYDEDGTVLGDYYADLLIEDTLIVELKAARATVDEHVAQLLGYLRASRVEHGLLVNFGAPVFFIKKYVMSDTLASAGRGLGRLASLLFLFAFLCALCGNLLGAEAPPTKPNVLFIAVDDLNHWVGYLGRNAQTITPNLDRLAKRGMWFTRSYCAAPVCNPSRAALMSGLRPGATGVYDNGENFAPVIPTDITLTTQFRKAGYFVCGAGKIYHASVYREGEWDDWLRNAGGGRAAREEDGAPQAAVLAGKLPITPLNCRDEDMADSKFVDYAIAQLNQKHDKPFFVACGLTKPHLPWSVPKQYYDKFPLEGIQLPPYKEDDLNDLPPIALQMATRSGDHEAILKQDGTNTWKQAIRAYLATINFCDTMVGRLLDAYDKSPARDNTIICFWSDHGWHLGEKHHWRKFALWEETTRAPHIWVVPGVTKPDSRCDRTVDYMSIYPTLMDLCGLPTPAHVQGKSIRPLLANPQMPWDQPAVTTYRQNNHTVRSEGWRYTHYSDGGEELYNETKDPYEWTNLAKQPGDSAPVRKDLGKYLPAENKPPAPGGGPAEGGEGGGAGARKNRQKRNQ